MKPNTPSILLVSNYTQHTGYAWKMIFKAFNAIAIAMHRRNLGICVSFPKIPDPIHIIDGEVPAIYFEFNPLHVDLNDLVTLIKNIRKNNIKYVYFTDSQSWRPLYALMRLWGIKTIIVHIHSSTPDRNLPKAEWGFKKYIKTILNNRRFLGADYVYVVSNFVRDRVVQKACYSSERIFKISPGIDVSSFAICQTSPRNEIVHIFIACRATKYKGVHLLIEAAHILINRYSTNNFLIEYAGDGPDLDDYKNMVDRFNLTNKFIFLGRVENIKDSICDSDIVVAPSMWGEAFGISIMEAMAAGKAVIATNVGGISEVAGNEFNAILIFPPDSKILAEKLFELIKNPKKREALGKNAKEYARKNFEEDIFHQRLITHLLKDFNI